MDLLRTYKEKIIGRVGEEGSPFSRVLRRFLGEISKGGDGFPSQHLESNRKVSQLVPKFPHENRCV